MLQAFTWFKQSSYLWRGDGLNVYIDPWEVTVEDPADVIFITHAHYDHYSPEDIERVRHEGTEIVAPRDVARELSGAVTAVEPGDSIQVAGIKVQTVAAYNLVEDRLEAHPKANRWVGYVLNLGTTATTTPGTPTTARSWTRCEPMWPFYRSGARTPWIPRRRPAWPARSHLRLRSPCTTGSWWVARPTPSGSGGRPTRSTLRSSPRSTPSSGGEPPRFVMAV